MENAYKRLRFACYATGLTMSVVANFPTLLFLTFRSLYGISYTQLGLLVLINYVTQLLVDLLFSFFSHKCDIPKFVRNTPAVAVLGLLLYAVWPYLAPNAVFPGLLVATVLFSASAGFAEALISPVIAAIPAKDPDREMSKLHSVYAWGVVAIVIVTTLFLLVFGKQAWPVLSVIFALIPLSATILFRGTIFPTMETPERASNVLNLLKNKGIWLCFIAIFLGGAAECTMSQWASGYIEKALGIEKVWGDVFGVALFALTLGLGRTLYAKYGKNMHRVLFIGAIATTLCYFTAAVSNIPVIGLLACALTGYFTAQFWPGNLVVASERFPSGGVFIFAFMAAGGDLGASLGPQFIGMVTDLVIASPKLVTIAQNLGLSSDQLGLKLGMLGGMFFPLIAIFIFRLNAKQQQE